MLCVASDVLRVYNFQDNYIHTCRHGRPLFSGHFTSKMKYNLENKDEEDFLYEPLFRIKEYLKT